MYRKKGKIPANILRKTHVQCNMQIDRPKVHHQRATEWIVKSFIPKG